MCCNLKTYVRAIALLCIILTSATIICLAIALASLDLIDDIASFTNQEYIVYIGVPAAIYVAHLVSYILCLLGASKDNKCLLIPFMIVTSLQVLLWLGIGIFIIYIGATASTLQLWIWLLLIPLIGALVLSTHFLIIVARLYGEIAQGDISGQQPGIVLKTYPVYPVHQYTSDHPNGIRRY